MPIHFLAIEDAVKVELGGVDLGEVVVIVDGELIDFVEEGELLGVLGHGGLDPVHIGNYTN